MLNLRDALEQSQKDGVPIGHFNVADWVLLKAVVAAGQELMRDPEPTKPVTDGIVFIGDSYTMGYGVQDNGAFPAIVRASLESRGITVPVLNTGMGDNGNGTWVKFFDHDVLRFRPRIVIFQSHGE
jgi:hypothetical protein